MSRLRYVVTGASGWLGRATLDELHRILGPQAFAARVHAYAGADRQVLLRGGGSVAAQALARLDALPAGPPTLLLHYAFVTPDMVAGTPAFIAANDTIAATVERAIRRLRPSGMVLMSSGATYRGDDPAREPYGARKRQDESRFAAQDCGRLVTCRLFNLSGPYINNLDHYVLACLIGDALAGRPLRLRAVRPVWRSYVHVSDVVRLTLGLATAPGPSVCFDTAGDVALEVGALAERVRAVLGRDALPIERSWNPAAPADRYLGDGALMHRLAAASGVRFRPIEEQIADTAAYLRGLTGRSG